jgi:ribosomal protein S27AE
MNEPGGDAVCWLHELCPECGAMPTAEQPDRCWRCGYPVSRDAPVTPKEPRADEG